MYSPVAVPQSPGLNTQGNLTGNARLIKDAAADLYNLIQKWNNCFITGANILQSIIDLKLPHISKLETATKEEYMYPKGLQKLCDDLENVFNDMSNVVNGMRSLVKLLSGVCKVEGSRRSGETIFRTWPTSKFENEVKIIISAYESELVVKRYIKENICHSTSKNTLLAYLPLWIQQCYVDSGINFRLEVMLKECGHR